MRETERLCGDFDFVFILPPPVSDPVVISSMLSVAKVIFVTRFHLALVM
jgi:hypothetical protein